jgi:TPR repeat protein
MLSKKSKLYLYRLATKQTCSQAQCALGFCPQEGTGANKNADEAFHCYCLDSHGFANAQFWLGCLENGRGAAENAEGGIRYDLDVCIGDGPRSLRYHK